jgi:lipoprotein-releasing system permease protein
MPWYLYLALKQLFTGGQRKFFTAISVLSVALGVGLMIIVLSVMGGFRNEIYKMMVETQGDIVVRCDGTLADPTPVQKLIEKVPGVVATTDFAQGVVGIQFEQRWEFPGIQGIDVDSVNRVMAIDHHMVEGSSADLDDDSIILSSRLARTIGAGVGSRVEVYSPALFENAQSSSVVLPKELRVAGIFQLNNQQLDSSLVIVTLREMQDLYNLGRSVHGIEVKITPGLDVTAETDRINAALVAGQGVLIPRIPGLWAVSWEETNQAILFAIQLEKRLMTFMLLFVVLVAGFLTMSLLLVMVLRKTREIGLLGALGASRLQIALCFSLQGVGIGVVGALCGLGLGFTLLHFRNDIVHFLTRLTQSQSALESVYQVSDLPAVTAASDLVVIVSAAIVLSTLAGIIPAVVAARLKPAEALRNE